MIRARLNSGSRQSGWRPAAAPRTGGTAPGRVVAVRPRFQGCLDLRQDRRGFYVLQALHARPGALPVASEARKGVGYPALARAVLPGAEVAVVPAPDEAHHRDVQG